MRVFIRDNYDDLSSTAAGFICDVIKASESKESKMVNIAFPSGRSVIGLYRELGRLCGEEGGVSFKNVRAFHLDEYCGLEEEDKMCQKNWMKKVSEGGERSEASSREGIHDTSSTSGFLLCAYQKPETPAVTIHRAST